MIMSSVPKVVKYLAAELAVPLTQIINLTFITGKIPMDLKTSIIVPVYKKLINYVNKIGILDEHQFGFRKNHSTNFALIDLVKITKALDNREFAVGVFLGLSKAFDTVNHSLLLQKLEHYGVRGIALKWFENYITKALSVCKI